MTEERAVQVKFALEGLVIAVSPLALPAAHAEHKRHARFTDERDLDAPYVCCVTARRVSDRWPFFIAATGYHPTRDAALAPGILYAPEYDILFLGAGERVRVYALSPPGLVAEANAEMGFRAWDRHGDMVLMTAELELSGFSIDGERRWTRFVEVPWGYSIDKDRVRLEVMGDASEFSLRTGR
jgi:hypothetical protein